MHVRRIFINKSGKQYRKQHCRKQRYVAQGVFIGLSPPKVGFSRINSVLFQKYFLLFWLEETDQVRVELAYKGFCTIQQK